MRKFDEKFMWYLSAETIRHYTEETLIHKIQENPEQVKMLSTILEAVFRKSNNNVCQEKRILTINCGEVPDDIYQYLRIKGFMVIRCISGNITIQW